MLAKVEKPTPPDTARLRRQLRSAIEKRDAVQAKHANSAAALAKAAEIVNQARATLAEHAGLAGEIAKLHADAIAAAVDTNSESIVLDLPADLRQRKAAALEAERRLADGLAAETRLDDDIRRLSREAAVFQTEAIEIAKQVVAIDAETIRRRAVEAQREAWRLSDIADGFDWLARNGKIQPSPDFAALQVQMNRRAAAFAKDPVLAEPHNWKSLLEGEVFKATSEWDKYLGSLLQNHAATFGELE